MTRWPEPGIRIQVGLAFAAPLDGPDAPLDWERCTCSVYGAEATEEAALDAARRLWVCHKAKLPTEIIDALSEWVVWDPRDDDPTDTQR